MLSTCTCLPCQAGVCWVTCRHGVQCWCWFCVPSLAPAHLPRCSAHPIVHPPTAVAALPAPSCPAGTLSASRAWRTPTVPAMPPPRTTSASLCPPVRMARIFLWMCMLGSCLPACPPAWDYPAAVCLLGHTPSCLVFAKHTTHICLPACLGWLLAQFPVDVCLAVPPPYRLQDCRGW